MVELPIPLAGLLLAALPSQQGTAAGHELTHAERFHQVVVGARVEFPKTAATADVQTLSPQLVGFRTALDPQGYQMADQKLGTQRSGEFTTAEGRKVYWRGEVFNATPPARPIWMEYRLSPF